MLRNLFFWSFSFTYYLVLCSYSFWCTLLCPVFFNILTVKRHRELAFWLCLISVVNAPCTLMAIVLFHRLGHFLWSFCWIFFYLSFVLLTYVCNLYIWSLMLLHRSPGLGSHFLISSSLSLPRCSNSSLLFSDWYSSFHLVHFIGKNLPINLHLTFLIFISKILNRLFHNVCHSTEFLFIVCMPLICVCVLFKFLLKFGSPFISLNIPVILLNLCNSM